MGPFTNFKKVSNTRKDIAKGFRRHRKCIQSLLQFVFSITFYGYDFIFDIYVNFQTINTNLKNKLQFPPLLYISIKFNLFRYSYHSLSSKTVKIHVVVKVNCLNIEERIVKTV